MFSTTRRFLFCATFATLLATCAGAQTLDEIKRMRVLYAEPKVRISVQKNLVYHRIGDQQLRFDLYRPAGARRQLPVVVMVHGDADPEVVRDIKDWGIYESYGRLVASRGFAAITFNHRSSGDFTKMREAAADVAAMLAFVHEHAEQLQLDDETVAIWSFSAGGAYLAPILRSPMPEIRCLIVFYPVLGIPDENVSEELRADFSAAAALPAGFATPIFLVRAGADDKGTLSLTDEFIAAALKKNAPLQVINYPSGHHAFDIFDPGSATHEVIETALLFLRQRLRKVGGA